MITKMLAVSTYKTIYMKSYHHGNLKEELIACACRLCERDGYTKLSIRSLAKESGVSQTAPYRHFETKEALYASVATNGFKKLSKACYIDTKKNVTKKHLVEIGCRYIEFGIENANTYDLMFGTAVRKFKDYPDLHEAANKTYDNMRSSFSELAKESEDIIAFKCLTLWSMVHGLVGIIRKVHEIGDDLEENTDGPMMAGRMVADNLEQHLDKVISSLIQN